MQTYNPRHQPPLRGDLTDPRSSGARTPGGQGSQAAPARLNDRRSTR